MHLATAILRDAVLRVRAQDSDSWEAKCAKLIADCHPRQRAFATDPGRRVCALVARGGGKTTGAIRRFVLRMLRTPKAKCLYIATTGDQAEELMWIPLKELCEEYNIDARFNETKRRCIFRRNGASIRLVGADNKREIEKLRGIPFHEVGVDESASYPTQLLEHLLFRIIGPRLGDHNGSLFLIGTPGHLLRGPFYEATRPGSPIHRKWSDRKKSEYKDWQRWSFHSWTLKDGAKHIPAMARLWKEAQIEKEANGWSDKNPVWLREYLGQWCADDSQHVYRYAAYDEHGQEWNQWAPERDKMGFAKLPGGLDDWRYSFGMDMGHSDPFALQVFAWSPSDPEKKLYHVYEFNKPGMYARTIAELLIGEDLDHDRMGGVIARSGWPDAIVADTAGLGGSFLDELANVYGVRVKPAEKRQKHDSIELFNGDLLDGRIKIMRDSMLEEQLLNLQWAEDDFGRLREHKSMRNDCTDAAIYARREAQHLLADEPGAPSPFFKSLPAIEMLEQPEPARGEFWETDDGDDDGQDDYWGE